MNRCYRCNVKCSSGICDHCNHKIAVTMAKQLREELEKLQKATFVRLLAPSDRRNAY